MREPTQQLIGKDGRVYTYLIHDKCTAFESGDYDGNAEKVLTEDNLDGNVRVLYRGKEYLTGNRWHDLVELWLDNKFYRTVRMASITVMKQ